MYKNYSSSYEYQMALLPYVEKNPSQFLLVCRNHHHLVEWLAKLDTAILRRLLKARILTQKGEKGSK